VGVLLLASIFGSLIRIMRVKPAMADFTGFPVIVIDPGHGGADGGAAANGLIEEDVNLAIGLTLRDLFELNGFNVIMTRETDISIHDAGITGNRKQKTSDLKNRLKLAEAQPDTIFISIHQNKFTSARSRGTQIFYGGKNPLSERLAKLMQDDFAGMLQPENKRACKKAGKNLFLMYEATCPSVLVECGFLSNADDAALLAKPEYQNKIAFTVMCSVLKFLET
jgi:N-acetylmuramoyl-L-alanine amidase